VQRWRRLGFGDGLRSVRVRPSSIKRHCHRRTTSSGQTAWSTYIPEGAGRCQAGFRRASLKERAGVKRGFGVQFRTRDAVCGHGGLTSSVPSLRLPIPCEREARVQDRAYGPAASGGAAGVLDAGDRTPIIRAAGKGHVAAGVGYAVVAAPWPAGGRAAPRAAYIPSRVPGMPAGVHGAGSRLAGRGQSRGRPRCRSGDGRRPAGAVRCTASRPAAGPVQVMWPVPGRRRGGCARRACRRRPG
jgi:hypothetical protein